MSNLCKGGVKCLNVPVLKLEEELEKAKLAVKPLEGKILMLESKIGLKANYP